MDPQDLFLAILAFTFASSSFTFVANASSLCDQTPYPKLCNSLAKTPKTTTLHDQTKTSFDIRDANLKFALAQAQSIHSLISTMDTSSFHDLTKSALADCMKLYDDTIDNLARSTSPATAPDDAQTWLSAAYANHETCKNGFTDFQLTSQLESFSFLSNYANFSEHLSNSLALSTMTATNNNLKQMKNRKLLVSESHDGFPAWVSATDRKLLQSSSSGAPKADITVAQDGSGNFKTISKALAASESRSSSSGRFVIHVKRGIYKENVEITKSMMNIMMIGDGIDATIVTGSKNVQDGSTTFNSATFAVTGDRFIAQGMTFENTAGAAKHQAVALRSDSDFSVFHRCSFKGYQDTLYVHSKRQFYRDCIVEGTVDFIFGDAIAVLQNCNINIRKPLSNQKNTVTAQGRTDPNENTGIVIHNSQITGSGLGSIQSYLGRPWKEYSRTVIMKTSIDSVIDPAGWLPWSGDFALSTLYYAEYANTGTGASTGGRVKWDGYRILTSATEARKFSVENFLAGSSWIPSTGVPFTAGV